MERKKVKLSLVYDNMFDSIGYNLEISIKELKETTNNEVDTIVCMLTDLYGFEYHLSNDFIYELRNKDMDSYVFGVKENEDYEDEEDRYNLVIYGIKRRKIRERAEFSHNGIKSLEIYTMGGWMSIC